MNIVRRYALNEGLKTLLRTDAVLAMLGDANGKPLRLLGEIFLWMRFGNNT